MTRYLDPTLTCETTDIEQLIRRWRRRITISGLGFFGAGISAGLLGGCGGAGMPTGSPVGLAPISVLDSAEYFAFVRPISYEDSHNGERGPDVWPEKAGFDCASALQQMSHRDDRDQQWNPAHDMIAELEELLEEESLSDEEAAEIRIELASLRADVEPEEEVRFNCPPEIASQLRQFENRRGVFVVGPNGSETFFDTAAAIAPIDSREKAAIAVWFHGGVLAFGIDGEEEPVGGLGSAFVRQVGSGFEVITGIEEEETEERGDCEEQVTTRRYQATVRVERDGRLREVDREHVDTREWQDVDTCYTRGRRPEHFQDRSDEGTLQGHFVRAMHHEAESVRAFERMANELDSFGEPGLASRARIAARDERRHAEMYAELARSFGYPLTPSIEPNSLPNRSLFEVALENAVEGCVVETFAAKVAMHQARFARTQTLRTHYRQIAQDELGHAALAHAADEVLSQRLTPDEREEKRRRMSEATPSLGRPSAVERFLGIPSA